MARLRMRLTLRNMRASPGFSASSTSPLGWTRTLLALAAVAVPVAGSELSNRIDAALHAVPAGGRAGVVVYDVTNGQLLYSHDPDTPMSLASTTKLLITAASFSACGQGWQFATRVYGGGKVNGGSVPGLGVIGGGDPCMDDHFYEDDPDLPFHQWADQLKKSGVTRIDGDIVIDTRLFTGPAFPPTWPQDLENKQRWYSAPASAFPWNDNCIELRVVPGNPGQPGEVQVRPQSARITVRNLSRSIGGHGDATISYNRDADANAVVVSGACAETTAWFPLADAADPDLLAGDQLKASLIASGIPVSGNVRLAGVDTSAGPLFIDQRHDLLPALSLMNHNSQNFYAEQMLRLVGRQKGGDGSIPSSCAAVIGTLKTIIGARADTISLFDGSGLSYDDRAPASTMLALVLALLKSPVADDFVSTLKTKDENYHDGPGMGHVKTGTHAEGCCLVGVIDLPDKRRIAFASLLNKGDARGFDWSGALRQAIYRIICDQ